MDIVTGILLSVCAVEDMLKGKITLLFSEIGLMVALILRIVDGTWIQSEAWIGLLAGGAIIIIALISRQQIGLGDGVILSVCGFCLGWKRWVLLFLGAMILFLVVGTCGILFAKQKTKKSVPFVPYLWIAFMIELLWIQGGG